ncbi:MAG TPA: hypothetical protein VN689_06060, partial [Burkholderiales bacterium]|nr:hypothetical protein [Burkholderiales bacterium]
LAFGQRYRSAIKPCGYGGRRIHGGLKDAEKTNLMHRTKREKVLIHKARKRDADMHEWATASRSNILLRM